MTNISTTLNNDTLEGEEVIMTEEHLFIAVSGLHLEAGTIEIAKLLLVDNIPNQKVEEETGLSRQRITAIKAQILNNFKKKISELGLIQMEVLVSKETSQAIRQLEHIDLERHTFSLKSKR